MILEASDICVSFGGVHALSQVRCEVRDGEILGIVGPNGAGKTTLLNALSRMVPVDRGAVMRFGDQDMMRMRPHELVRVGLARTFQGTEMSSTDTLLENVLTGAHIHWRGWRSRRARAGLRAEAVSLMATYGIERWGDVPARDAPYAVGKRAQVCRALLCRPSLLLLDEPAAGMTAAEKEQMRDGLVQTNREAGVALAIIEHDVGFLTSMSQRLLALNFGHVIAAGSVDEVVSDPQVIEAYLGASDDDD